MAYATLDFVKGTAEVYGVPLAEQGLTDFDPESLLQSKPQLA